MHAQHPGTNWAGNIAYGARTLFTPRSLDEVADLVAREPRLRVLGSRHSFNGLAATDGVLVSLAALPQEPVALIADDVVRVPAAARHGDVVAELADLGVALQNLVSLPHISFAGAVATGTHGSGDGIGTLSSHVEAIDFLGADGELHRIARGDADFEGHVVHLGALGIVVSLDIRVVPAFDVAQTVYEGVTWDAALAEFDALTSLGASVSCFTTWRDVERIDQVWVKSRVPAPAPDLSAFGGRPADGPRHPVPGMDPTPCTQQGGVPGPWYDRLPHFRLGFSPSAGAEIQSEYLLDRADLPAAMAALRRMDRRIARLLHVSEIRTMVADDLWLSPAYGRDTVGIHFTWRDDAAAVAALLPDIEAALPASARPHWGKVFSMGAAEVHRRYPRLVEFADLRQAVDPERKFVNDFLAGLGL